MTTKTKADIVFEHLAAGRGPLTSAGLAELFQVSMYQGCKIMTTITHSKAYKVTITRDGVGMTKTNVKQIVAMSRLKGQTRGELARKRLADHFTKNPTAAPWAAARSCGSCAKIAKQVRIKLIADGVIPDVRPVHKNQDSHPGDESGTIVPTKRHPEDEPHLARAVRFRQVWPMRVQS
jgi:hypothetical protein